MDDVRKFELRGSWVFLPPKKSHEFEGELSEIKVNETVFKVEELKSSSKKENR